MKTQGYKGIKILIFEKIEDTNKIEKIETKRKR